MRTQREFHQATALLRLLFQFTILFVLLVAAPDVSWGTITFTQRPSGTPNPVASGGTVTLTVTAVQSLGHSLTYVWSASCVSVLGSNGSFSNPSSQTTTWTAPMNSTGSSQGCTMQVRASDGQGDSDFDVYAQFVTSAGLLALTVSIIGNGSGTVATSQSPPQGINCGSGTPNTGTCTASFTSGTSVTLTATQIGSSSFDGWGGDCAFAGTALTCTLTINSPKSVTAAFTQISSFGLSVQVFGSGTVTSSPAGINCPGTCSASFTAGTTVTLLANRTASSTLQSWGGDCTGQNDLCLVAMSGPKSVMATFTQISGTITGLTATPSSAQVNQAVTITVVGTGPCGGLALAFGDGGSTGLTGSLPLTTSHSYASAGQFTLTATGVNNCTGFASANVTVNSAGQPSIAWTIPPPSVVTSETPFTVAWSISGGSPTHINVHWDQTNPGGPGNPSGNINPTCQQSSTSCSTVSPTSSPAPLTAPTVIASTVVRYLVHATVNGTDIFTDTRDVTVNPVPTTTGSLKVTVLRSDTNAPLQGASVALRGGPSSPAPQTTGADGTTTFSNLAVGSYTVAASLAGFQTNRASATISANTTTPIPIFLTPQEAKRVVILVHGILGDPSSFGMMGPLLESTGQFKVFSFDYSTVSNIGTVAEPIEFIGRQLKVNCIDNILKRNKGCAPMNTPPSLQPDITDPIDTSGVDIVAHSMGGLVTLAYISGLSVLPYENDIGKLVTLATPFFGSPLEALTLIIEGWPFGGEQPPNTQAHQMKRGGEFIWRLHEQWRKTDFALNKKADILNVVGTLDVTSFGGDGVVPIASAALPDQTIRTRYVYRCHLLTKPGATDVCPVPLAVAYVPDEFHPSFQLVRSFLRDRSDPQNCSECRTTPPTTTGDLFVRFVEKDDPTIPIPIYEFAHEEVLSFDPNPKDLGGSPGFKNGGGAGTLLVTDLPAGPYLPTVHGSKFNLVTPSYLDEVLPIASINAGRTIVLPQLELQKTADIYTVTLATAKGVWVAGKDVFSLAVQLCCTIPTAQSNSYQSFASAALSQSTLIDGYVWVDVPGGDQFFLMPDFTNFTDVRMPVVTSLPVQDFAGTILNMPIPADLPTGTYTFLTVGVVPGGDPFNSANWVTNRAELSVTLTQ